jgi:hypothetical protein
MPKTIQKNTTQKTNKDEQHALHGHQKQVMNQGKAVPVSYKRPAMLLI